MFKSPFNWLIAIVSFIIIMFMSLWFMHLIKGLNIDGFIGAFTAMVEILGVLVLMKKIDKK